MTYFLTKTNNKTHLLLNLTSRSCQFVVAICENKTPIQTNQGNMSGLLYLCLLLPYQGLIFTTLWANSADILKKKQNKKNKLLSENNEVLTFHAK